MSVLKSLLVAEGGVFTATSVIDGRVIILNDNTGVHVSHFNNAISDGLIEVDDKTDTITPAKGVRTFTDNDGYRYWTNKAGAQKVSELLK